MRHLAGVLSFTLFIGITGFAHAAGSDSFTLDVSAEVASTCKITTSGPYTLHFSLDPSSQQDATATTSTVGFWCTEGVVFSITDDGSGSHALAGPDANPIPYSLAYTPSLTAGAGPVQPILLTIDGTVAYSAFANKKAGTYTDTVIVTISP